MCTMIVDKVEIDGSGKGTSGWFTDFRDAHKIITLVAVTRRNL